MVRQNTAGTLLIHHHESLACPRLSSPTTDEPAADCSSNALTLLSHALDAGSPADEGAFVVREYT